MTKAKPAETQDEPTAPRQIDEATGRALDEHGLPLSGPARARALGGRADPALAESSNPPASADPAPTPDEK